MQSRVVAKRVSRLLAVINRCPALMPWVTLALALFACAPETTSTPNESSMDGGVDSTFDVMDAIVSMMPDMAPPDFGQVPRAPGPDPSLFDCDADFIDPGRRSPVPMNCVLDSQCTEPMVVGHRGVGGQFGGIAPENSLASIRAALLLGLDGIELDIRHTADDRLVVIHDSTVDRTTTGTGKIDEMTLDEVTGLQVLNSPLHDVPGNFDCETVPTIEEAFALTRGKLFIDLDTKTHRMDLVVAAIREAGLIDEVFISVGDVNRAVEARAIDPEIRIQIRPDTPEALVDHLSRFVRTPEIIEIPAQNIEAMAPTIIEADAKVFSDVFGDDAFALLAEDLDVYGRRFAAGAQILQSELPSLVIEALGRFEDEPTP